MKNTIRAQAIFSFKGETHDLATTIDLDSCLVEPGTTPNIHLLIAKACGIDTYSYLYEALESQDILFSDPTGIPASCCHDGGFDWTQFARLQRDSHDLAILRDIARRTLGVADLNARDDLKTALLEAYRAGQRG